MTYPLYRDPLKFEVYQKVLDYDLTKVEASVRVYQPDIDIDKVMPQYRNFLYLAAVTGGKLPVPTKAIDGIWHAAILYTKDYAEFCQAIANRFIHHSPIDEPLTQEQIEQRRKRLESVSIENFGCMLFNFEADAVCSCSSCYEPG